MSYKTTKSNGCSFCKDKSHHIKQCLVLANNKCGNCNKLGHTTRHCRRNNNRSKKFSRRVQKHSPSENGEWEVVTKKYPTKKVNQISPTHISYNRFNGVECELVIERNPPDGIPTYKDVILKDKLKEKENAESESCPLPMFKRIIPKGVRWADICDEESDDEFY